jgi:hypothetical protein
MQVAAEQQGATVSVTDVPVPSEVGTAMDVDPAVSSGGKGKRKAEEPPPAESSKKARIGEHILLASGFFGHQFANFKVYRANTAHIEEVSKLLLQMSPLTFILEQRS